MQLNDPRNSDETIGDISLCREMLLTQTRKDVKSDNIDAICIFAELVVVSHIRSQEKVSKSFRTFL